MEVEDRRLEAARLFSEIGKTLNRSMRKSFEEIGVTMPQGMVLKALMKSREIKLTDLSRELNMSNSTISGIIDRLEKQNMVVRVRSEEDRRIIFVKATPKVEELHVKIHNKAEESFKNLLGAGSPEEIDKIYDGLKTLRKIIRKCE